MRYIFLVEYTIILFININLRLRLQLIEFSPIITYISNAIYIVTLGAELLNFNILKAKWTLKKNYPVSRFYVLLIMIYFMAFLNRNSNIEQILLSIMLLCMVFVTAKMISKLNCLKDIVKCSFIGIVVIFIMICLKNDINVLSILPINIAYLVGFSSVRVRSELAFYSVNAAGNLLACALNISYIMHHLVNNGFYKLIYWISVFFIFLLLLSTGSRTAIVSVCICFLVPIVQKILKSKFIVSNQRFFGRVFIVITGILILYNLVVPTYIAIRGRVYDNVNLLQSAKERLTGYGLIEPGRFINMSIGGVRGYYMDNYYVYVYATMGIIGLFVMIAFFTYIGIDLLKYSRINNGDFGIFACFIGCIASGFGETCVFYYLFPSSFIYFSIFVSRLYDERKQTPIL